MCNSQLSAQTAPESISCTSSRYAQHQGLWCVCCAPDPHNTPFLVGGAGYHLKAWKIPRLPAKSPLKGGAAGTWWWGGSQVSVNHPCLRSTSQIVKTLSFCKKLPGNRPVFEKDWCLHGFHHQILDSFSWVVAYLTFKPFSKPTLHAV